jgi:catechol 2,3-dioxygenase-like lactoylglutathione lyase family enzyme
VPPPPLNGVLETVLYCTSENEPAVRRFYEETLGLQKLDFDFAYRVAPNELLLVFNADQTRDQARPPAHGASGPGHMCFLTPADEYEGWKRYLQGAGVEITDELTWGNGKRSFYFDDPAGNVLEIADGDIWAG